MHDQLATGRKLRVLMVVGTFSRCAPILDVRFNYRGEDVVNSLNRVCAKIGYPNTNRVPSHGLYANHCRAADNGPEFISGGLDLWAYHRGVVLDFSWLGKPNDNAFIEAINGKFR